MEIYEMTGNNLTYHERLAMGIWRSYKAMVNKNEDAASDMKKLIPLGSDLILTYHDIVKLPDNELNNIIEKFKKIREFYLPPKTKIKRELTKVTINGVDHELNKTQLKALNKQYDDQNKEIDELNKDNQKLIKQYEDEWDYLSDELKEGLVNFGCFDQYGNLLESFSLVESADLHETDNKIKYLNSIGVNYDDLGYLGSGDFGTAYSMGNGKVLKVTSSKTEFAIAKELMKNNYSSFAKIYDTQVIDGEMIIILEELEVDGDVEDLWYQLSEILDAQGLPPVYVGNVDIDDWREQGNEVSDELESFINDVYGMSVDYRNLGIEAADIRPENMGMSEDGTYKAFDIEDKSGRFTSLTESIDIINIPLYHGSSVDFDEFSKSPIDKHDYGYAKIGIYLTPSLHAARIYATKEENGIIYSVKLNNPNIFICEFNDDLNPCRWIENTSEYYRKVNNIDHKTSNIVASHDWKSMMIDKGYDGFYDNEAEIVIFNPSDIVITKKTPVSVNMNVETIKNILSEDKSGIFESIENDKTTITESYENNKIMAYKIMALEGGQVVSGANKSIKIDLPKIGDIMTMPGKGIFMSPNKQYVLDYYSEHNPKELLITFEADVNDITSGNLTDNESEISVTKAKVVSIEELNNSELFESLNESSLGSWFGKSVVTNEDGSPKVMYHGSSSKFDAFDISKVGNINGRSEGAGFYFTDAKEIADGYSGRDGESHLYEVYLKIERPIAYDQKALNRSQCAKLVHAVAKLEAEDEGMEIGDGYLANYGDVSYEGLNNVIRSVADSLQGDETLLDQVGGIIGSGVRPNIVNEALYQTFGFDGFHSNGFGGEGGRGGNIFIAMFPWQIKSIGNEVYSDSHNMNEVITESVSSVTLYHGTAVNPETAFKEFTKHKGVRSSMMGNREVEVDWTYFTDDYNLATKFAQAKAEYYNDSGESTKPVVYIVDIDMNSLNILDLSNDDYEEVLDSVGIDVISDYGIGSYYQSQMWEYLDEIDSSNKIKSSGFDAVRLLEPNQSTSYNSNANDVHSAIGASLAIHHSKLSSVNISDIQYNGKSLNESETKDESETEEDSYDELSNIHDSNEEELLHGTDESFDRFEKDVKGSRMYGLKEYESNTHGHYFTKSEDMAHEFGSNIIRRNITLKKPLNIISVLNSSSGIEQLKSKYGEDRAKLLIERLYSDIEYILEPVIETNGDSKYTEVGITNHEYEKFDDGTFDYTSIIGDRDDGIPWDIFDNAEVGKRMEERGYDGAYVDEGENAVDDDSNISVFVINPDKDMLTESIVNYKDYTDKIKPMTTNELVNFNWDKEVFGFSFGDIIEVPLDKLNVKWTDDMLNVDGFNMSEYFKGTEYSELPPIEVSFDGKEFFIEDGHHRYGYAKELGLETVKVEIESMRITLDDLIGIGLDDLVKYKESLTESLTESFNEDAGNDLLKPMGQSQNIGEEKGKFNPDDFSMFKNPYGSIRFVYAEGGDIKAALQVMSTDGGKTGVIANIFVDPEVRRQGMGTKLHEYAKSKVKYLVHSDSLTDDGENWKSSLSESINGSLIQLESVTAYHGTGMEFDTFDSEKIGTGEEVTKYGYGIYFTASDETAQYYADRAAGGGKVYTVKLLDTPTIDWNAPISSSFGVDNLSELSIDLAGRDDVEAITDVAEEYLDYDYDRYQQMLTRVLVNNTDIEAWEELDDALDTDMLEEDGIEFSWSNLQQLLSNASIEFDVDYQTFGDLYNHLTQLQEPKVISKLMVKQGIRVIKYQGNETGESATNYVVFDPSIIKMMN